MRVLIALLLVALSGSYAAKHMKIVNSWHDVEYVFPDEDTRAIMIEDGRYIPGNSVPIAFDIDTERDRIFISMPRFKPGNAAALATVTNQKNAKGDFKLKPYPSWRWHRQGDCEGITSVFRVLVDECDRLWVVDPGTIGGSIDASVGVNRICPAQLLVFDLKTDKLIKRFEYPLNQIRSSTVITTIAVDVRSKDNKCLDTFAYVADVSGFGLLVYDNNKDESWRVESNEMFPYPPMGLFKIAGREFDLMDGVLGLALTPKEPGKERYLYFHSLAGDRESWVSTTVLRNKTNFGSSGNLVPRKFFTSPEARGQSAAEAFDDNGVLFFSILPKLSLNCWNSQKEYKRENLVEIDQDTEQFQFASGLKVKKNKQGVAEVWMLSSRFQMHMNEGVTSNEVNYRLMKAPVDKLVQGTSCAVTKKPTQGGGNGGGNGGGSGGSYGSGSGNRPTGGGNREGTIGGIGSSRPGNGGPRPGSTGGVNKPGGSYGGSTGSRPGGHAMVEGGIIYPNEEDDQKIQPVPSKGGNNNNNNKGSYSG